MQLLCLSNHGILLYSHVTNSSQFITTNKSFDAVALQSFEVHRALQERCGEIVTEKGELPKLPRDLDFLTKASGSPLLFLPFANTDEHIAFAEYAKDNIGVGEAAVAIHLNRVVVNDKNLMPKLSVHVRMHRENFDRNQRIRGMEDKTKCVRKK